MIVIPRLRLIALAACIALATNGCGDSGPATSGRARSPVGSSAGVAPTPSSTSTARSSEEQTCEPGAGTSAPMARGYHALVDVPSGGVLLISGAPNPESSFFADTWAFDPLSGWRDEAACPVVDVTDHAAYDARVNRVYAGVGATWLFEPGSPAWERVAAPGPPFAPGSRSAYDTSSGLVVMVLSDGTTWTLDVGRRAWTRERTRSSAPARGWGAIAYDALSDRTVLFGGIADDVHLADTWSFDLDHLSWTKLEPASGPAGRTYAAMTYVPSIDRVLLFGGASGEWEAETVHDDLWAFDLPSVTWKRLDPGGARPSARAWHAMAYDAESDLVVLFGGGPDRRHYTDETWLYDAATNRWREW